MFTINDNLAKINNEEIIKKYGNFPPSPKHLCVSAIDTHFLDDLSGAILQSLEMRLEYPSGTASVFAEELRLSVDSPVIVAVTENGRISELKLSVEELVRRGFGALCINAESVSSIRGELRHSADKIMLPARRSGDSAGKIALYAFAMTLAVDYLSSHGFSEFISFGGELFAESALLCTAMDSRINLVIADSPYITERSARFLPNELYSIDYYKSRFGAMPNLFSSISPRLAILGYYLGAAPYELDIVSDMLSSAYGEDIPDMDFSSPYGRENVHGSGCSLCLFDGAPMLSADSTSRYLDIAEQFLSLESRPLVTV